MEGQFKYYSSILSLSIIEVSRLCSAVSRNIQVHVGDRAYIMSAVILCAGWDDMHPHTADLICLSCCRPPSRCTIPELRTVSTQLKVDAWEILLSDYPDKAYVHYIIRGL